MITVDERSEIQEKIDRLYDKQQIYQGDIIDWENKIQEYGDYLEKVEEEMEELENQLEELQTD